ncbi:transglutaminase-like cysteine peptidase [Comamonas sp. Y33R10-2]|uniref:transglutaminase-like cysteine peptidase n=1 Tax=Comamonas sp. Y33R10-2 TaxID=2853257 RepID=UPI001C5C86AB|nr:transglutaminase-like cysteine peptidase [Comamonas sp. Y33R10-2]QXZ10626.1 transglutaminase-like cysteine peptidase [Comamonas sp. Y33R10-2]
MLVLGSAALGVWAFKDGPGAIALDFDATRLQQTMQSRYGAAGAKALSEWLAMLQAQQGKALQQQLSGINEFWNRAVVHTEDAVLWSQPDYWATPLETLGKGAGDCEDFVVGKYFSLLRLGVPLEKLRLIYVRARMGGVGSTQSIAHMVLGYYETPVAEPLVLDSMVNFLLPASQRKDLTPVFSFNAQGVYVAGAQPSSVDRITRWRDLLVRMKQEGFLP